MNGRERQKLGQGFLAVCEVCTAMFNLLKALEGDQLSALTSQHSKATFISASAVPDPATGQQTLPVSSCARVVCLINYLYVLHRTLPV